MKKILLLATATFMFTSCAVLEESVSNINCSFDVTDESCSLEQIYDKYASNPEKLRVALERYNQRNAPVQVPAPAIEKNSTSQASTPTKTKPARSKAKPQPKRNSPAKATNTKQSGTAASGANDKTSKTDKNVEKKTNKSKPAQICNPLMKSVGKC